MSKSLTDFECFVRLPLGVVHVTVARAGLDITARGGFEARWASDAEVAAAQVLNQEDFRLRVRAYLKYLYEQTHQQVASAITLNLASHQLLDDVIGWTKLNYSSQD